MLNMTNDTSDKYYCENGKRSFSFKEANIKAFGIKRKLGVKQRVYACELGNHYHLTSEIKTYNDKDRKINNHKRNRHEYYEDY